MSRVISGVVYSTAGTGSETTGAAIVDITSRNFKTGIASRALRPILGIVDTQNSPTCPTQVQISSGLDVVRWSTALSVARVLLVSTPLLNSFSMPWRATPPYRE